MWMIVGLGNPGNKYALNRHNIGFITVDALLKSVGNPPTQIEKSAQVSHFKMDGQKILTVKPQSYMNRSGESVSALLHFYKIPIENLVVIQDDIDQPFGKMRFHKNRGHGGHNGIRDISEKLGTPDYIRLKLGVGRPIVPQMAVADWVLQNFSDDEMIQMNEFINKSLNAIEAVVFNGLSKASTQFN
jgi:PTH1 family peptidyl-tRNA hydrolase